ncbi:MAG: restriction endonuclease subunit R, partial [Methylococcales bacterium]|nr:restriction endonuclease subunit R [Methylococcales bacterium]
FDHWGVVEYHGAKQREVEISQSKPLMQRLFETRLQLAQESLQKGEVDLFELLANWIVQTINQLNDKTIAVRDKWREKRQLGDLDTIRQFSPNTVTALETEIAPLMQWIDVRGYSDAYQFDLLMTQIIQAKLNNTNQFNDLRSDVIHWLHNLQMRLNQVRAKADIIKQARELSFWDDAGLIELEEARVNLRDVMRYKESTGQETVPVPVTDIKDGDIETEQQTTHLKAVDLKAYEKQVESALNELFNQDPILIKIRQGEAVTDQELAQLNALVHTQHPNVDFAELKQFYPSAQGLDQILRNIVGMEVSAVNQRFAQFVQDYPSLNAKQVRFLNMLQNHIAKYGAIEIDALYEAPFTLIDSGGFDALITDDSQADELIDIIDSFGPVAKKDTDGDNKHP